MKKIFLLIICSTFSIIINAQYLYVKNTTNTHSLDVYDIKKFGFSCSGSSYYFMTNMTGIPPEGSASQMYYAAYASVTDIELSFTYNFASVTNQQFCGTPQTGTIGGAIWDLYATGFETDMALYIHY